MIYQCRDNFEYLYKTATPIQKMQIETIEEYYMKLEKGYIDSIKKISALESEIKLLKKGINTLSSKKKYWKDKYIELGGM